MRHDLILHNGTAITVNAAGDVLPNAVIVIDDGEIVHIASRKGTERLPDARRILDADGGFILPGLINAHTHLPMTLFRGLADDLPLHAWLNEHIFPAEAAHVRPETVGHATRLACAEMLLSGTTTCCDGYFLEHHVAEAVTETGMRAILGQGVIDFPAPGVPDPSRNVEAAVRFVRDWKSRNGRIQPAIFCHSPYTCSADTLRRAKEAANREGVLFKIHVAETRMEREECLARHGKSPVAYLDDLGVLDKQTLLVHLVWVDEADMAIVARSGALVAHCPESNMKLASGVAPTPTLLARGVAVGLGTDGCASNNDLDMFGEMRTAALLHKVIRMDPTVMDARTVLEMATIRSARAIGMDHLIGSLEGGKRADIIVLNSRQAHLTPVYHPLSHVVYAARGADVRHVMVEGEVLVEQGTFRRDHCFAAAMPDIRHLLSDGS